LNWQVEIQNPLSKALGTFTWSAQTRRKSSNNDHRFADDNELNIHEINLIDFFFGLLFSGTRDAFASVPFHRGFSRSLPVNPQNSSLGRLQHEHLQVGISRNTCPDHNALMQCCIQ
jgi:hypothetical protein